MAQVPSPTAPAAGMAPATPSPTSAPAAAADDGGKPRRPVSCLAKTIGAALDGGIFGAAIGGLMATGPAFSHGLMNGGMRFIMRSGMQSALSVGGVMAAVLHIILIRNVPSSGPDAALR